MSSFELTRTFLDLVKEEKFNDSALESFIIKYQTAINKLNNEIKRHEFGTFYEDVEIEKSEILKYIEMATYSSFNKAFILNEEIAYYCAISSGYTSVDYWINEDIDNIIENWIDQYEEPEEFQKWINLKLKEKSIDTKAKADAFNLHDKFRNIKYLNSLREISKYKRIYEDFKSMMFSGSRSLRDFRLSDIETEELNKKVHAATKTLDESKQFNCIDITKNLYELIKFELYQHIKTEKIKHFGLVAKKCVSCETIIWITDSKTLSLYHRKKHCSSKCRKQTSDEKKPQDYRKQLMSKRRSEGKK